MKILFIVPSYIPAYVYGGPIISVSRLAEGLANLGHAVTVYTSTANGPDELDVPLKQPVMINGVSVKYFKRITKDHTHASPSLWSATWSTAKEYDVVHLHSWWNFLVMGASLICSMKGIRAVLSPHGVLCEFVFQHKNQFPKKVMHKVLGKYLMTKTYLHVTSDTEWQECRQLHNTWEGEMIYNLVSLPKGRYERTKNEVFKICFFSRIHPKKGLEILLHALAQVDFPYLLQIAGSGEAEYLDTLRSLIKELKMEDKVEWVGWKNNEEKFAFLAGTDLFALTSHNENFAMVVLESLAVGTPVLISEHVGLAKYVKENNLGWITNNEVEDVKDLLNEAFDNREERLRINREAIDRVQEDFNETRLATDYVTMYKHARVKNN